MKHFGRVSYWSKGSASFDLIFNRTILTTIMRKKKKNEGKIREREQKTETRRPSRRLLKII